jgi:hypothetical protein
MLDSIVRERHLADQTHKPVNVAALLGVVWLVVVAQLLFQNWANMALTLGDSDDAMRLIEARALVDGRGWFDLHEPRIAPPTGFDTHWSRLIDGGLWLLFATIRPFADAAFAERLMRAAWPLLWLLPAMIGVTAISWRLAGRQAAYAALLLLAVGLPAFQQFRPGRIDHHNVQIALVVLILAATVWADRKPWAAWAAGLLSGLAVAIGFESAPFVAVAGAVFVIRAIVEPATARALAAYAMAAAASTTILFVASVSPAFWLKPACDAIAINSVAAVLIAGTGLAVAALRFKNIGAGARCAAVSAIGAIAVAVALTLEPRCLGGPFATLDPAVWPIWHSHVRELQSLVAIGRQQWAVGAAIAAYPLAGLLAAAVLAADMKTRRDPAFAIIAAALVLAAAMTAAAIRTSPYAMWLCIPIVAAAALQLSHWLNFKSLAARVAVLMLLTPMVVSAGALIIAEAAGGPPVVERANAGCFQSASYGELAKLPKGIVAADVDYGSFVVALTPHAVLAAPYHRLSAAIIGSHRIFASPPQHARQLLSAAGVRYVLMCGDRPPEGLSATERRDSLWNRLHDNTVPDWLEAMPRSGPLNVYRVRS